MIGDPKQYLVTQRVGAGLAMFARTSLLKAAFLGLKNEKSQW
jgi:hypothetical protein